MKNVKRLKLEDVRFDGGTQMRVGLDGDTVAEYRQAYESGVDMPPAVVYFDGSDYWLADGFHRWHALHESGAELIECEVHKGSQRDAIWHAVGANASHGLRRTNEDKHKAVETVLRDEEWAKLSDRQIADHCGVSNVFVSKLRNQLLTVNSSHNGQSTRRVGKDGKARIMPKPAAKLAELPPVVDGEPDDEQDDAEPDVSDEPEQARLKPPRQSHGRTTDESGHEYATVIALVENRDRMLARVIYAWPELDKEARSRIAAVVSEEGC